MSEHYHFAKKEDGSENYPDFAFTLETLLKSGVCQGYAVSLIYPLRKIQIPVIYVVGNADGLEFGGHAWNMVQKENGEFSHLDITWDLGNSRNHSMPAYYLLDDIEMRSRRHFWQTKNYPVCA